MREIKFRAFDKNSKRMIYRIERGGPPGELFVEYLDPISPSEYVIMQYIGLKDKNGKEIFGDDILKANNRPQPYLVDWIGYMAAWFPFCKEEINNKGFEVEVIGNIHENHELLK